MCCPAAAGPWWSAVGSVVVVGVGVVVVGVAVVVGTGLLVVSALVIGGIYPAIVQQFQVKPSELVREQEYIQRNIDATRAAYDIADAEITDYPGTVDPPTPAVTVGRSHASAHAASAASYDAPDSSAS